MLQIRTWTVLFSKLRARIVNVTFQSETEQICYVYPKCVKQRQYRHCYTCCMDVHEGYKLPQTQRFIFLYNYLPTLPSNHKWLLSNYGLSEVMESS